MAFDFGKLKKNVTDVAKNATEAANTFVKSAQENLPESMKDIDVKASMMEMASKGTQAVVKFTKQSAETDKAVKKVLEEQKKEHLISYEDAVRIIYCLITVDRTISEEETEKFNDIGKQIDPLFMNYRDRIIEECQSEFDKATDDEDYYDVVHDYVADIIRGSDVKDDKAINGKSLYWNLLATAYVDEGYSEDEKRLIKYVARLLDIDKTINTEMESALKTMLAIEKEEKFLEESGRSYKEVQKHMEDLDTRKKAIMQGIFALVSD